MPAHLDLSLPLRTRANLRARLPALRAAGARVMLYPAGRMSRILLDQGYLEDLEVLGLLDRDPALAGTSFRGLKISSLEEGLRLGPDLILVCSSEYHREIMAGLALLPIPCEDLCQDLEPGAQAPLRVEPSAGGARIRHPGPPERILHLGPDPWLRFGLRDFERIFRWLEPTGGQGPERDFRPRFPRFRVPAAGTTMVFGNLFEACIYCRIREALEISAPFREETGPPLEPETLPLLRPEFLEGRSWRPDLASGAPLAWNLR